jgi:uncharacterized integral membrane protein
MKRFAWFITVPVALAFIAFAVANRREVILSFDPFSLDAPAIGFRLPLWLVAFLAFLIGIMVGGAASWIARSRSEMRRAAREREKIKDTRPSGALEGVPAIASNPNPSAPAAILHPPSSVLTRRG